MDEIKKVLVTGNKGYIGSVLADILIKKGYFVKGIDSGFYEGIVDVRIREEHQNKDIRNITERDLEGIEAVIHLAALSNDPLGEFKKELTREINHFTTIKLANMAKKCGARRFIFASSQSMYGISQDSNELDEDRSAKNPITEYAKTKWEAEIELKKLGTNDFIVSCFRPSTVFGASSNLRCDIVFNNLVACGYTTGKIEIKSDGSPWRPVVHVKDVCKAFIAGLIAPSDLINNESFNVGISGGNYTIRELAENAQRVVGNCELTFTNEQGPDSRTYKVSFNKILTKLKDYYKPEYDLLSGGRELVKFFDKINFGEDMFRGRKCNRLPQLKYLLEEGKLDGDLFWVRK